MNVVEGHSSAKFALPRWFPVLLCCYICIFLLLRSSLLSEWFIVTTGLWLIRLATCF